MALTWDYALDHAAGLRKVNGRAHLRLLCSLSAAVGYCLAALSRVLVPVLISACLLRQWPRFANGRTCMPGRAQPPFNPVHCPFSLSGFHATAFSRSLLSVQVAQAFRKEESIFFPHNLDFRGRAYPMHPHLNHLGGDVNRGLLQFADAKPLGPSGLKWLKVSVSAERHCAPVVLLLVLQ